MATTIWPGIWMSPFFLSRKTPGKIFRFIEVSHDITKKKRDQNAIYLVYNNVSPFRFTVEDRKYSEEIVIKRPFERDETLKMAFLRLAGSKEMKIKIQPIGDIS